MGWPKLWPRSEVVPAREACLGAHGWALPRICHKFRAFHHAPPIAKTRGGGLGRGTSQ